MPQTYVVLDIETTGLNAERDAIIEIGAVKFSGAEILESWSSLVNPRRELSRKIQRLTGINQAELDTAPSLFELTKPLVTFIGSHALVGHNVAFDIKFLNRQGLLIGHPALDTFEMASILLPEAPRYSLGLLAEMLGIAPETQHRALADAQTTHQLFLALWERAQRLAPSYIREINRAAGQTAWPLRELFRDVEREQTLTTFTDPSRKRPSADGDLAEPLASPTRRQESLKPSAETKPVDVAALVEMISPGGAFEQQFPGYEFRPQQVEMLETVAEAFNNQEHLLVEAGTGTGKSLAYLLPAIYFAYQNSEHVVISTNTINLQDQLAGKDIPDLQKLLPFEFTAAVLKGRSNYLCRRRLNTFRHNTAFTIDQVRVLAKLLCWLPQTTAGDRSELVLIPSENSAWAQVQAEAETCLAERCIYRQRGQCFLYRARGNAEAAHLIVINHALLLSDMVTENRVLPEYNYLIVDEAHHLEESATDQLGFSADQWQLGRFLGELSRPESGVGRYSGFLTELLSRLREGGLAQSIYQEVAGRALLCHDQVAYAQAALKALFAELSIFLDNFRQEAQNRNDYDMTIRLTHALRSQPDWTSVELLWDDVAKPLRKLEQGLEQLGQAVKELEGLEIPQYEELMQETLGHLTRLREMSGQLEAILTNPTHAGIYWAQVRAQDGAISLHMAPLRVAPLLQKSLFARKKCAILTSATLCSAEGFDYIRERLGLEDANESKVGSPFDYKASTLIYAPTDIPEPGQPNYQRAVERALVQLSLATKGRALVLFTSNSQLQNTYRAITPELEEEGIVVYAQGLDGGRRQILESFKSTPQSVLLGTRSFWEGVDVVGSALSCLVVVRLPFSVPSDPVFSARSETFDEPFAQYAVPEAILRFRQGFGRLIRSTTDRGVVVILDKRVLSKAYGASFIRALPRCTTRQGLLKDLPIVAARWIDGQK